MNSGIAYTTHEGCEIRRLLSENKNLLHLLEEVQFIGSNVNDIEALKFLKERITFHNLFKPM